MPTCPASQVPTLLPIHAEGHIVLEYRLTKTSTRLPAYRFVRNNVATPAAKPTAATAAAPPTAASFNFLASSRSFASIQAKWSSAAARLSGLDLRICSHRPCHSNECLYECCVTKHNALYEKEHN